MTSPYEPDRVAQWLVDTLDGNVAGVSNRVYQWEVPPMVDTWPVVVIAPMGTSAMGTINGTRVLDQGLWLVKAIDKTAGGPSQAGITTVADAIDTALNRASGTKDGVQIAGCVREATVAIPPERAGDDAYFVTLAQLYRVWAFAG